MVALAVGKCKVSEHVLGVGFSIGLGDSSAIGALFHEHILAVQLWLGMVGVKGSPEAARSEALRKSGRGFYVLLTLRKVRLRLLRRIVQTRQLLGTGKLPSCSV